MKFWTKEIRDQAAFEGKWPHERDHDAFKHKQRDYGGCHAGKSQRTTSDMNVWWSWKPDRRASILSDIKLGLHTFLVRTDSYRSKNNISVWTRKILALLDNQEEEIFWGSHEEEGCRCTRQTPSAACKKKIIRKIPVKNVSPGKENYRRLQKRIFPVSSV